VSTAIPDSSTSRGSRSTLLEDLLIVDTDVHVHESPGELAPYCDMPWRVALEHTATLPEVYLDISGFSPGNALEARFPTTHDAIRMVTTPQQMREELSEIHVDLAILNVEVKGGSEPIRLQVGKRSVPRTRWKAIPVLPGDVEVVVSSPGRTVNESVKAVAANEHRVAIDLSEPDRPLSRLAPPMAEAQANPEVLPPGPASGEPVSDTSSTRSGSLLPWAFVATGVGAAGFITFGIAGSMARSSESELEESCVNDVCPASLQETVDEGRTRQTIANIGLVVGAIGLGGAVTLFVLDSNRQDQAAARAPRIQLVANPRGGAVRGEF